MDEKPYQLLSLTRPSLPMEPGSPEREDFEYIRIGLCSIYIFAEPLGSWRYAEAFPQRTKKDWAHRIKWLLDKQYNKAEKVVLVMDNLNTHAISSLYEAFRLAGRLEIHFTPKHGSWLNITEIELSSEVFKYGFLLDFLLRCLRCLCAAVLRGKRYGIVHISSY
jgi:hypothetical protein